MEFQLNSLLKLIDSLTSNTVHQITIKRRVALMTLTMMTYFDYYNYSR